MIVIDSLNYIGITVSNLDAAVKFYKDSFDFEIIDKMSGSGRAVLKMGDILLSLQEVENFSCQEEAKNCMSFFVDEEDFDDAVDELKELEVAIVQGPENISNGQAVVFSDPDGNRIELSYPKVQG